MFIAFLFVFWGLCVATDVVWEYHQVSANQRFDDQPANWALYPGGRSAAGFSPCHGYMLLHGGVSTFGLCGDLWSLDVATYDWNYEDVTAGTATQSYNVRTDWDGFSGFPGARQGHSFVALEDQEAGIYLFGGLGFSENPSQGAVAAPLPDLWHMQGSTPDSFNWTLLSKDFVTMYYNVATNFSIPAPAARHSHAAWVWGADMYIWGGIGCVVDAGPCITILGGMLWQYSHSSESWSRIPEGSSPDPRSEAMFWAAYYDGVYTPRFYLFGGVTASGIQNDLWEWRPEYLDANVTRWVERQTSSGTTGTFAVLPSRVGRPGKMSGAAASFNSGAKYLQKYTVHPNSFGVIFGGDGYASGLQGALRSTWMYDSWTGEWIWVNLQATDDESYADAARPPNYGLPHPEPRTEVVIGGHGSSGQVFVFGGLLGGGTRRQDLFSLRLSCADGTPSDAQFSCFGHGSCAPASDPVCSCIPDWEWMGEQCSYPWCHGAYGPFLNLSVCSGHGVCYEANNCTCHDQWKDVMCDEKVKCGLYTFDSPQVCLNRGTCVAEDVCDCNQGYTGAFCDISECFGISSLEKETCLGHGVCFAVDRCMCTKKYYGRECLEFFEDDIIVLMGLTTDKVLSVLVDYVITTDLIPDSEMPFGTQFNCTKRLLEASDAVYLGPNNLCHWLPWNGTHNSTTQGVNITVSDTDFPIFIDGNEVEITFRLLTSDNWFEVVRVRIKVTLIKPPQHIEVRTFNVVILVAVLIPVLFVLIFTCVVVVALVGFVLAYRKKTRAAELRMADKAAELLEVQATFMRDTERLQKELALQKLRGGQLPTEFVQLEALDEDQKFIELEPLPGERVWSRTIVKKASWQGHVVVMKKLNKEHRIVTTYVVEDLLSLTKNFASLPIHPHLRRYHAFYVGSSSVPATPAPKKSADPDKPTQPMSDDKKKLLSEEDPLLGTVKPEEETIEIPKKGIPTFEVPEHAILIEFCANGNIVDCMWKKQSDAQRSLAGVTVRSGVSMQMKVKWLQQLASALHHLHIYDFVLRHLSIHCVFLDSELNVKLDVPFLPRPPETSPFAAPEVVLEAIGEKPSWEREIAVGGEGPAVGFEELTGVELAQKADIYSFGMIAFAILTETKRPCRHIRSLLQPRQKIGVRAAQDSSFRPALDDDLLPPWSGNVLERCWADDPRDRMTLPELVDFFGHVSVVMSETVAGGEAEDESSSSEFLESEGESENEEEGEHGKDKKALLVPGRMSLPPGLFTKAAGSTPLPPMHGRAAPEPPVRGSRPAPPVPGSRPPGRAPPVPGSRPPGRAPPIPAHTAHDPSGGYVDPAAAGGYADPSAGYVDPAAGYVDPSVGYVDPSAGYVDPAAGGYVDPGTYYDPSAGDPAGGDAALPDSIAADLAALGIDTSGAGGDVVVDTESLLAGGSVLDILKDEL